MLSIWFVFIALSQIHPPVDCLRSFFIKWHNITYKVYSPKVASQNVILANQDTIPTFDGYIIFKEPVDKVIIDASVDIIPAKGTPRRVFQYTLDVCQAYKTARVRNVITISFYELQTLGHLPNSCPMPVNENFTFKNYHFEAEQFPPYTPELTFIVHMDIQECGTKAGFIHVIGSVVSKQERRLKVNLIYVFKKEEDDHHS